MQKKKTTLSVHRYSLFRGTETEAVQSQSSHGSISVHLESGEGRLNRTSVLVTLRTRPWLHHRQNDYMLPPDHAIENAVNLYDNVNLPPPAPPPPLPHPPPPCVSGLSVFLDSSSSIKGFMSNVEPQNLTELVKNKAYGLGVTAPAAMLGVYYPPPLHPQAPQHHNVDPPLLSQRGPITFGAFMEQPAPPLIN